MGKKSRDKQAAKSQGKKQQRVSLKERLATYFATKNPILLFVLVFGVLMALFYGFWITDFFKENVLSPVLHVNARVASFILNLFSYGTSVYGKEISNTDFSIEVARGCDAIEPTALFVSGVLSFPSTIKKKLQGIVIGIVVLMTINMFRVLSLFLTGIYAPSLFEIMHMEVWQVVFIMLALACWLIWVQYAMKKPNISRV